ncbi:MAG TPA: serine/threonine-protein kinase [Gemmataceae bacterium]|nr:serine/threonine-protein kinase [Gemmataceae bacterium]
MAVPATGVDFLERVRKSELLDPARLDEYVSHLGEADSDPRKLATQMIRDGMLTYFHAAMLLQGKSKGFRLGHYQVLERLGSGGMGNVYLCYHTVLKRCAAIKVLPTDKSREHVWRERFRREAEAIAGLNHPNIVRAYDVGEDRQLHYLVMEFVEGISLTSLVRQKGALPYSQACHYMRQAALGLQHAFEIGIIHRDIKPENLLITRDGAVKILDMGLVLFHGKNEEELTARFEKGSILGTADYLSPEQAIDSHKVDIRSDIYSLGATFYLALTGRTLFSEGSVAQKLLWHQVRPVTPVRQHRPDVPEELEAVVMKMLAKAPDDRFATPAAVVKALEPWTEGLPPAPEARSTQRLSRLALTLVGSDAEEAPAHQSIMNALASFKPEVEKPTARSRNTEAGPQAVTVPSPVVEKTKPEPVKQEPVAAPAAPVRAGRAPLALWLWIAMGGVVTFLLAVIAVLVVLLLQK